MLDLLQDLADRGEGPTLFLCPARPELTARRPGWGGGRWNHSSLLLEPLSAAESGQLLDLLVERGTVTSDLRSGSSSERAQPVLPRGDRAAPDGRARRAVAGDPRHRSGCARRADRSAHPAREARPAIGLGDRTHLLERRRAVVARPGSRSLELDEVLRRLEDRGLVHARIGSTIVGEREFSFRHILTRDVAYDGLPRRDRARAHARVAEWIELQTREREREFAELLTHHYDGRTERSMRGSTRSGRSRATAAARVSVLAAGRQGSGEQAGTAAGGAIRRDRPVPRHGDTRARPRPRDTRHDVLPRLRRRPGVAMLQGGIDLLIGTPRRSRGSALTLAGLCAVALEMITRAPGTMRHRVSREEGERYLEIGLAAAGTNDSEERTRLLIAGSFPPRLRSGRPMTGSWSGRSAPARRPPRWPSDWDAWTWNRPRSTGSRPRISRWGATA